MRVVYEAENLIDAHLIKGLLENEDIPAYVRGEHLIGAMGELPVMGLIAVCVADVHYAEADRLLAAWRVEVAPEPESECWDAEPDPA